VAELLGVTRATVYNWEHGLTAPRPQHLPALTELFGRRKFASTIYPSLRGSNTPRQDAALQRAIETLRAEETPA
jgi:transcriptional regulator with XRE-family HTH domain